jgi:hypothetical protein
MSNLTPRKTISLTRQLMIGNLTRSEFLRNNRCEYFPLQRLASSECYYIVYRLPTSVHVVLNTLIFYVFSIKPFYFCTKLGGFSVRQLQGVKGFFNMPNPQSGRDRGAVISRIVREYHHVCLALGKDSSHSTSQQQPLCMAGAQGLSAELS